jgi:hypothetical protein
MDSNLLFFKVREKYWTIISSITKNTKLYPFCFTSYWHYLLHKSKGYTVTEEMYFTCRPHLFAGIGHQMANWIAGYWWSKQLGLKFAHIPFSTKVWDDFLGFGYNEPQVKKLSKNGYKIIRIPEFSENHITSIELVKRIISSYKDRKVIFIPPQDHGYKDQFGIMNDLKKKFNNAPFRIKDNLVYSKSNYNIAIHVRRTVIIEGRVIDESKDTKSLRWLSNNYYFKVLEQVLNTIVVSKPIVIHIFSTAEHEEFEEFKAFGNIFWGNNMDEYNSFLHLVRADLLITSKSSFSYKPALISDGVKICPETFWHNYPDTNDYILADNLGNFDNNKLKRLFK